MTRDVARLGMRVTVDGEPGEIIALHADFYPRPSWETAVIQFDNCRTPREMFLKYVEALGTANEAPAANSDAPEAKQK